MVDAGDAGRQFDTLDRLVALESTGSDEAGSFGNDEPRFDGLVRGDEDRVYPETTVTRSMVFGRTIAVRFLQPLKALSPIAMTV